MAPRQYKQDHAIVIVRGLERKASSIDTSIKLVTWRTRLRIAKAKKVHFYHSISKNKNQSESPPPARRSENKRRRRVRSNVGRTSDRCVNAATLKAKRQLIFRLYRSTLSRIMHTICNDISQSHKIKWTKFGSVSQLNLRELGFLDINGSRILCG